VDDLGGDTNKVAGSGKLRIYFILLGMWNKSDMGLFGEGSNDKQ